MAWWRLEWIKLKRKRTQKLFWQNKKLATAEKSVNRTAVENESCCLPSWTQCDVASTLKPLQLSSIAEHFSANGLMESRCYLGVMKIAAHELQYRRAGDGVDEITDHPAPASPVMHSITGRFSAALWGATKVHVKSFDTEPLSSPIALKELSVLLELRHPGILLLMGVSYTGTTGLQLVFENISIGSLYHVLHVQQSNFTVEDICRIVIKLCEALRFMHQHLWLHLGLSSHALQLTAQGHYKLAAFELAKKQTHNSICRMSLDDARYQESIINWQAPEQCLGDPVGPETDIYTLSVMLQEMITGRVPWEQSKAKHVRRRYASGGSLRNQGWLVSAETHAVLQRGLVVPRSQRTLTLDDLEDLCSKYLGPNVVAERRILAITGNSRMKKPNRTSKLLSFQSVKRHLSSCQACTFNTSSPDPLRKSEVYGKKVIGANNYEEILQIPEEIYFDDHFDPSTKLGTHLQLLP